MLYKEYFKFPLQLKYGIKVMTEDYNMAFDFIPKFLEPSALELDDDTKEHLVKILNGENLLLKEKLVFHREGTVIYVNHRPLIMIRSWGRLTGIGGYNLPPDEAVKIQDSFGDFIVSTLNATVFNETLY